MAIEEHVEVAKKGAEAIKAWREENQEVRLDLSKADLPEADLREADLSEADLSEADLSEANLHEANLRSANLSCAFLHRADLREANLSRANLRSADLRETNLRNAKLNRTNVSQANLDIADLSYANLRRANLRKANLSRANLSRADLDSAHLNAARIGYTSLCNLDLSKAHGLETVEHRGPSSIDVNTLQRSRGLIADVFLRGCGLSAWEIESAKLYYPDLTPDQIVDISYRLVDIRTTQPIQFYSCFISYSSKDDEFARRLHGRLEQEGLRVWFAPEDMKGGQKTYDQIDEAIRLHDKLLLVLSPASMKSKWVAQEIRRTRRLEKKGEQKLFPIALCSFKKIKEWELPDSSDADLAEEVRQYHIPDLSEWKDHDAFEKAFEQLVSDLKSAGGAGNGD